MQRAHWGFSCFWQDLRHIEDESQLLCFPLVDSKTSRACEASTVGLSDIYNTWPKWESGNANVTGARLSWLIINPPVLFSPSNHLEMTHGLRTARYFTFIPHIQLLKWTYEVRWRSFVYRCRAKPANSSGLFSFRCLSPWKPSLQLTSERHELHGKWCVISRSICLVKCNDSMI